MLLSRQRLCDLLGPLLGLVCEGLELAVLLPTLEGRGEVPLCGSEIQVELQIINLVRIIYSIHIHIAVLYMYMSELEYNYILLHT